jgi:hypothetical protein
VVISRMLQWYSWISFKGFPSMPKGEIVGMFSDRGRLCVFVIDGKDHDQQHNDGSMERSEAKDHFGYHKLKSILEFWILGVGGVKSQDSSSQESQTREM